MSNIFQLLERRNSPKPAIVEVATRRVASFADLLIAMKKLTDTFCICMEECSNDNVDAAVRMYDLAAMAKDTDFIESTVEKLKALCAPVPVVETPVMKYAY